MKTLARVCLLLSCFAVANRAAADDQTCFAAINDCTATLVQAINAETVRLDVGIWLLSEHSISIAIANRWAAGVPVRLIGDRVAIFESDAHTRSEFYWLASQGIPIRLRYNPTWFPEIIHWKTAILVGQNKVFFGSGNFTPTELTPVNSTNYDDESFMLTDDPALVGAFKTKFDVMWHDTANEPSNYVSAPYLKNWDDACALESVCSNSSSGYHAQYPNPVPMHIDTTRLEPDNPMPADMIWGQGQVFNDRLVTEINNENAHIDLIEYRLTVPSVGAALINKFRAGVPVRLIVDTFQYANPLWPEYELTHAYVDQIYAAGIPIRQRVHDGVTHMKTLITSTYATNASSNYAKGWQRDNDYFVSASAKPAVYNALKDRFETMWADNVGFTTFSPGPPNAATVNSPASGASNVATNVSLVWNRAFFATSFDVYLGTSSSNMALVGSVDAVLSETPPATYSFTPATELAAGTTYFWKVVSKTFATPVNPSLIATSPTFSFTTGGSPGQPGTPGSPNPSNGATSVAINASLAWTAASATSYDVAFGTSNPPPTVSSGQSAASYTPSTLANSTTYFWQIVAHNSSGSATGPVWSFTTVPVPPPGAPAAPSPANAATGVAISPTLAWTSSGATSYDVAFGTANPPPSVSTGQASASYTPATLAYSTTYFWRIVAHNSGGAASGPVWTFTTAAPPPGAPGSPNPASGATGVSTTPSLTWSAANATSYDVSFGTANPPPTVSTGQTAASYSPPPLAQSTTYFWQIVAHTSSGSSTGPVWSFTTGVPTPAGTNVVVTLSSVVQVMFASVTSPGTTWAANADTPNGGFRNDMRYGPIFALNTTAAVAGPITVKIAYGAGFSKWERGMRVLNGNTDVTQAVDLNQHVATGTIADLPATVAAAEDHESFNSVDDSTFTYTSGMWAAGWQVVPTHTAGRSPDDLFLYNPDNGAWYDATSGGGSFNYTSGNALTGAKAYAGDFNGDGRPDVFLYNAVSGGWALLLNDGTGGYATTTGTWTAGWSIQVGDLDGDRRSDLFLYNSTSGQWYEVFVDGAGSLTYFAGAWSSGWNVTVADLNGDGKADLFLYNGTTGIWYQALAAGRGQFNYVTGQWATGWQITAADLNGDHVDDLFLYNAQTGAWYQAISNGAGGFVYGSGAWAPGWAVHAGRFDLSGRTDILVENFVTGDAYICLPDGAGGFNSYLQARWPITMEVTVLNLDSDGRADVFLFDPRTGQWFKGSQR